jgi:polyhydroxybutyrate depolymerase
LGGADTTGGKAGTGRGGNPGAGTNAAGGSSSAAGANATGGTNAAAGGANRSPGCGKAVTRPDPKVQQTMDIGGTTRYYLLDVPTSADNQTPLMLIFALHGHNMNNVSVVGLYNFTSRSNGKAITVYPQGDGDAPGTTSKWGSGITSNWTSNETNYTFIQTLMNDLESRFCIDPSRVFITGFSMGGMFTNAIACAHNSWFRGFAPVEGMGPGSCADKNAKPAIMIHQGTADTTVTPTAGGEPTRDFWIKQNGCNQTTTSAFTGCQSYGACAEPVDYCVGSWNHTVDSIATANIWSFFNGL